MNPDLKPELSGNEGEAVFRPFVDIEIKGSEVNISRPGLPLNEEGPTEYRIQEEAKGKIKRCSFEAFVVNRKLEFTIHTWMDDGRHLDLAAAKGIAIGEAFEKKVEVDRNGTLLSFEIKVLFRE